MSISSRAGGKATFPLAGVVGISHDRKALTLKLGLEPNKEYVFKIKGRRFKSEDGYPLKDFQVRFSTARN